MEAIRTTTGNLAQLYREWSVAELRAVVASASGYTAEAQEAASQELRKRGCDVVDPEVSEADGSVTEDGEDIGENASLTFQWIAFGIVAVLMIGKAGFTAEGVGYGLGSAFGLAVLVTLLTWWYKPIRPYVPGIYIAVAVLKLLLA